MHISHLRKKLECNDRELIKTIRGSATSSAAPARKPPIETEYGLHEDAALVLRYRHPDVRGRNDCDCAQLQFGRTASRSARVIATGRVVRSTIRVRNRGSRAAPSNLERFERITEAEGILTDSSGRDLLTGEDRSDLVQAIRERSRIPFVRRNRTVVGRRSSDGAYYYFVLLRAGT